VPADLDPPHHHLTFMTPLSEDRAAHMVAFLAEGLSGTVVDIGCGWAELLLRVVAAAPNCRGIGIDVNEVALAHGRALAERRALSDRVTLIHGDAATKAPAVAQAVICIGASQVWNPPSEVSLPLDYARALAAIRGTLRPGGRVVYGDGIWSRPPTNSAVAALGGRADEFVRLDQLVEIAVTAGFAPVAFHEADLREWDAFESGYSAGLAYWLSTHDAADPDESDVRGRAQRQRNAYLLGYRKILGMGYLQLVAV
jgi:SAM-dependent methyltransferase